MAAPAPEGLPGHKTLTRDFSVNLSAPLGNRENFLNALPRSQGLQETAWGGGRGCSTGVSGPEAPRLRSVLRRLPPPLV